ncbi:hypothetical protein K4K58_010911 [Colletotrichum sp. SAR11_239]|nr:hypothetical protein K4K58_010911 [Colletotrichum sp. SAR11_239]
MPAHWGADEEERLVNLVRDNFIPSPSSRLGRWHDNSIDFVVHTEAEAIAHFICHKRYCIDELSDESTDKFVLFLDFGGHCLNGCIFYIRKRNANGVSFFRAEEPFAVVSGTEHWVARVAKFCCSNAVVDGQVIGDATLRPEVRNLLVSRFREHIRLHKADDFPRMSLRVNDPDTNEDIHVTISAESNAQFFREAFGETLIASEEAIYRLQRMSNEQNAESLVIVTGGSVDD